MIVVPPLEPSKADSTTVEIEMQELENAGETSGNFPVLTYFMLLYVFLLPILCFRIY